MPPHLMLVENYYSKGNNKGITRKFINNQCGNYGWVVKWNTSPSNIKQGRTKLAFQPAFKQSLWNKKTIRNICLSFSVKHNLEWELKNTIIKINSWFAFIHSKASTFSHSLGTACHCLIIVLFCSKLFSYYFHSFLHKSFLFSLSYWGKPGENWR